MSPMNGARSVRAILTFWYTAVLVVAFAVFAGAVYLYLERVLLASLDQNLLEETDWIGRLVEVDRTRFAGNASVEKLSEDIERRIMDHFARGPRNYVVILTTTGGKLLYRSGGPTAADLAPGGGSADTSLVRSVEEPGRGALRVASRRAPPLVITVGYDVRATSSVLEHFLTVVGILLPAALFMSLAGGYFMAGVALRPVHRIAQMAERITADRLDLRIPARPVNDELGMLIRTINTMIGRLEASFLQIREFSLSVAHELRTPLTILKGEAELALARGASADDAQRLAVLTLEETARMARIVDDLLTLARADAGQIIIERAPVALHGLLAEVHEDATILAGDHQLTVELVRNDPVTVKGDRGRLRQLLRVLVANAVQYTDPGGMLRLSCTAGASDVALAVEDTGIGIPSDSLERIFERFYRTDQARERARGGSGLGLTVARWIAEAHGGRISVTSTPGAGSRFTVHLPRTPAA